MKILLALSLAILAGCVPARDPQLTAIKQAEDSGLGCEQIGTNTDVAQGKITKNNSNDNRELLFGILVWPGLFDLKNADGNEANALLDRNIYLRELAKGKSCAAVDAWPGQPKRYTAIGDWVA